MDDAQKQIAELQEQIQKLESLRQVLGDDITDQKRGSLGIAVIGGISRSM